MRKQTFSELFTDHQFHLWLWCLPLNSNVYIFWSLFWFLIFVCSGLLTSTQKQWSNFPDSGSGSGLAETSSISSEAESVDDVWSITDEQRDYYINQFKSMQPELSGVISGDLPIMQLSGVISGDLPIMQLSGVISGDYPSCNCLALYQVITHHATVRRYIRWLPIMQLSGVISGDYPSCNCPALYQVITHHATVRRYIRWLPIMQLSGVISGDYPSCNCPALYQVITHHATVRRYIRWLPIMQLSGVISGDYPSCNCLVLYQVITPSKGWPLTWKSGEMRGDFWWKSQGNSWKTVKVREEFGEN